jgi:hypothetical protein
LADGFHGAAVNTQSLDNYLNTLKELVPDVIEKVQSSEMRALRPEQLKEKLAEDKQKAKSGNAPRTRGEIQSNRSPKQIEGRTIVAANCAETLAYLDQRNVFPHEFPGFPMHQIPKYRNMAKTILGHLGTEGMTAVVAAINTLLTERNEYGIEYHPNAAKDLLDLLKPGLKSGQVDPKDVVALLTSASGAKRNPAVSKLATQVTDLVLTSSDRETLAAVDKLITDPKLRQHFAAEKARRINGIIKSLGSGDIAELLNLIPAVEDDRIRKMAIDRLGDHSLTVEEARQHLPAIWKLIQAQDKTLTAKVRKSLQSAISRAPVVDCLTWITEGDPELADLTWKQLGARFDKADAKSKREFRDASIKSLADLKTAIAAKQTSIEVLRRLKDPEAAKLLLDAIPQRDQIKVIPLVLWPQVAALLRELTGEKFGPQEGEKASAALGQINQWRKWRSAHGGTE